MWSRGKEHIKIGKKEEINQKNDAMFCFLICLSAVLLAIIIKPENAMYGSEKDWLSQHLAFAQYFRERYLRTGDFFPDFAPELGGGQNIYHFAYYGLLSPYVIASCLFPGIPMERWFFNQQNG